MRASTRPLLFLRTNRKLYRSWNHLLESIRNCSGDVNRRRTLERGRPERCANSYSWGHLLIVDMGRRLGIPVALYRGVTAGGQRISGTLGGDFRGFKNMTPGVMWWFLGLYRNGIYERPWRSRVTTRFRLQDPSKVGVKKSISGYLVENPKGPKDS